MKKREIAYQAKKNPEYKIVLTEDNSLRLMKKGLFVWHTVREAENNPLTHIECWTHLYGLTLTEYGRKCVTTNFNVCK